MESAPANPTAGETGASARIARFAHATRYGDIPERVLELGKAHILDALGLSLAGAASPAGRIAREYVAGLGCTAGAASVLGSALRTAPRFAAFANGVAIHAHDYDDTNPQHRPERNGGVHASGAVIAAALAAAEPAGRSGREVAEAFHVGVEVACRLNHAVATRHYDGGFHATGTINVFGTAMAVGKLIGLDPERLRVALGLAASQSSGVRENFGTMTKPFHSGHAAECGTVAAELAGRGFTAATHALEAPRGFFAAAAGGFDPAPIAGLGNPWAFVDPGMWIKPHPCGALTHPAMGLVGELARTHGIEPEAVRRVRVSTNDKIANILLHNRPRTWLEAKFSMPFCVAIILVRGRAGLAEFTDEVVNAPEVRRMIDRVEYLPYSRIEPGYTNTTTFVEIALTDGRTVSGRVDYPKGSPHDPMSFEEVAGKFRDCADYARWPKERTEGAIAAIRRLDALADIREMTALLSD